MRIQVKDFMSKPVVATTAEDSVSDIRQSMKEKGIHAMPVVEYSNDTLMVDVAIKGIVTSSDLEKDVAETAKVADVMTASSIHVVHEDSSAQAAAKMLLKHDVRHIVVMKNGEITGMVSSQDFVKLVAENKFE
jgi:CBS domain-containing protein